MAGAKSVSVYDDKYRSRSYHFVERQKPVTPLRRLHVIDGLPLPYLNYDVSGHVRLALQLRPGIDRKADGFQPTLSAVFGAALIAGDKSKAQTKTTEGDQVRRESVAVEGLKVMASWTGPMTPERPLMKCLLCYDESTFKDSVSLSILNQSNKLATERTWTSPSFVKKAHHKFKH